MGVIPTGTGDRPGENPLLASLRVAMRPPEQNPGGLASSSSTVIPGEWATRGDPGLITPRGSVAGAWANRPTLVAKALGTPYQAERRLNPPPEGLEEAESFQEEALESEANTSDDYSLVSEEENVGAAETPENEEEDMQQSSPFSFLRPANEALVWHFATATEKCCTWQHWGSVVPFSKNDTHKSRSAVYCRTWHAVWTTVHSMAPAQGSYRLHMAQEKGRLLRLPFAALFPKS